MRWLKRLGFVVITLFITACGATAPVASPTPIPPFVGTLPPTSAPAVGATATPIARLIPTPFTSQNPNVQDPTFAALPGAKAYFGQVSGSGYRIEMPDKWNGDLVLYAHGFRSTTPQLNVTNLPVRELAIQQGFAWAASSFRANGYNPEDGVQDTLILRELFIQQFGTPKRTYIYGSSMGGHVVVASLEQYPDVYAGGLSECGVVSGIGEFDYLLSYVLLAGYFAGVDPTTLPKGDIQGASAMLTQKLYLALGESADKLTDKGKQFRSAVIHLTGGHRPFAEEGFANRYKANFEGGFGVLLDPSFKGRAATNVDVQYHVDPGLDDAALNAGVKRVAADPNARNAEQHYEYTRFKGSLKAPLLTIHDTGDLFVPISLEQQYRATVDAAGASAMLAQRAIRRYQHCDFSPAERTRAWNDLVAWVAEGKRPDGNDLRGSLLEVGKMFTQPLRLDDPGRP